MWVAHNADHMVDDDDGPVPVKTYVPQYQKDNWKEHAEQLDMSQSEFVKAMVQAGRREFGVETNERREIDESSDPENTDSSGATPGVGGLEDRILDVLDEGPASWEDIVDAVVGDLEAEIDEALGTLQADGRIRYSGRIGGYELLEQ